MARRYTLKSTEAVCTPGIIRAVMCDANNQDPGQRLWAYRMMLTGFPTLLAGVVVGLLDGDVDYTIDNENEEVVLTLTDEQERKLGLPTKKEESCSVLEPLSQTG